MKEKKESSVENEDDIEIIDIKLKAEKNLEEMKIDRSEACG